MKIYMLSRILMVSGNVDERVCENGGHVMG
jgi:hypothetical protein